MTVNEYMLSEVLEPHLFVIRKEKRDSPEKVTPMLTYYVLDGSIYQAPQLCNVFDARIGRAIYHISKVFMIAASKLEKIGHAAADAETEGANAEPKTKEPIDIKELKRVDLILASLQWKPHHQLSQKAMLHQHLKERIPLKTTKHRSAAPYGGSYYRPRSVQKDEISMRVSAIISFPGSISLLNSPLPSANRICAF